MAADCCITRMDSLNLSGRRKVSATNSSAPWWRIGGVTSGRARIAVCSGAVRRPEARFQRVDEPLHLPNIAFFGLSESPDGRVFAGGPSGLFCFENGKLHPHNQGRDLDMVYHVSLARDGSLWVSTNHGLRIIGDSAKDP